MKLALFAFSFVVSVGLVVFALMTAYRVKKQHETSFASSLFYYVVFMAAFGFYSIWSYLAVRFLLTHVISSPDTLLNVVGIFPFLGFPLLLVGWYLFIQFCIELTGRKLKGIVSILYFSTCVLVFLALANYFRTHLVQNEAVRLSLLFNSFALANFIVVSLGSVIFLVTRQNKPQNLDKPILAALLLVPALLATIALFMASSHWIAIILFVLFYFSQITLSPAWIYFQADPVQNDTDDFFTLFCDRFEITKREAEIILEICAGKTNQAIADSLFITVQTVKDHAHRIYTKTGVRNRIQLVNLVNDQIKPPQATI